MAGDADPKDLVKTVWGETADLTAKDGSAATQRRLFAVVGKLAIAAHDAGLDRSLTKREPPQTDSPDEAAYKTMKAAVLAVRAGTWDGERLPARAVLWEIAESGAPRTDFQALPAEAAWIAETGTLHGGDFAKGEGANARVYRLFESAIPPQKGEYPYMSAATGSGLAAPVNSRKRLAWAAGITAIVLIIAGMALAVWTGRSISNAHALMSATQPSIQTAVIANVAALCHNDYEAFPAADLSRICQDLLDDKRGLPSKEKVKIDGRTVERLGWPPEKAAAQNAVFAGARNCLADPTGAGCNTIWRAALATDQDLTASRAWFGFLDSASAWLTGTQGAAGAVTVFWPMVLLWLGSSLLVVALGLGTKARPAGVWIDVRNRVSLARAQVTLWTIVALGGYAVLVAFNVGMLGTTARDAMAATGVWPATIQAFAKFPPSIAAALGIALVSSMASALILGTKSAFDVSAATDADVANRGARFFGTLTSGLDIRASPRAASIADVFMGEENAVKDTVDLARLQNVLITILLVLGYGSLLIDLVRDIPPVRLLAAFKDAKVIFASLPDPGATFASLLLVSHATYLASKAHDKPGEKSAAP